jgi:hypothetical protein
MTTRRRNVLVLLAVLALGSLGAWLLAPSVRERAAIEAIPAGAFLVVTIDLEKARNSPLAHDLAELADVGEMTELCGYDPVAHVRTIAIGVPEKPDGVFGIAFTHDLSDDDLGKCAQRVMSVRSATPRFTQHGSWTILEQEGMIAEASRAKIAYRSGSPVLVARGDYLATMQGALDGQTARAESEGDHKALRKSATHPGTIAIATAVLPKSIRERIQNEMEGETSPEKNTTMSAVLAVRAVTVSLAATRGDDLDVFAELACENEGACLTLRDFLDKKRKSIAKEPAARFAGIGAILDGARVEAKGATLEVTLSGTEPEMARAARAVLTAAFGPADKKVVPTSPKARPSASGFSPGP